MKIGLLALSGVQVRTERIAKLGVTLPGFVKRGKIIASLPSLARLIIAALTPEDIEVEYNNWFWNELWTDDLNNSVDFYK